MTLLINDREYDFRITDDALDKIEATIGKSLMSALAEQGGMLKLAELKTVIGFSLKNIDGGKLPLKQAYELAGDMIRAEGYRAVSEKVAVQVEEDLPFLFQGA